MGQAADWPIYFGGFLQPGSNRIRAERVSSALTPDGASSHSRPDKVKKPFDLFFEIFPAEFLFWKLKRVFWFVDS